MNYLPKVAAIFSIFIIYGCNWSYSATNAEQNTNKSLESTPTPSVINEDPPTGYSSANSVQFFAALPPSTPNRQLLVESWESYRRRFIQRDGRVIDYEASDRSTSEGQAYAMLRAVLIDDPATFALTLNWGENNLQRLEGGKPVDSLWAWKWGRKSDGSWGSIDENFASDGDIDAITALIFASRRWNRPDYLKIAKTKLQDLWKYSTVVGAEGKRYLLPGPKAAFVKNSSNFYLNPSYFAPYAFRLFAQVDPERDWLSLVDTSYEVLKDSRQISAVNLPSDWVVLDSKTGKYQPVPPDSPLSSAYSFDAFRVWWRIALDASWFNSSQARSYLETSTQHLIKLWQEQSSIPARINLEGKALVNYEATSQYAMLYAASKLIEPELAQELLDQKLLPRYQQEVWDDNEAYYTQNLAWLGLLSPKAISPELLQNN
ncbi:MAG: glycosyl hydrolase family 8 [Cyanobacteria bacterium J06635_10]